MHSSASSARIIHNTKPQPINTDKTNFIPSLQQKPIWNGHFSASKFKNTQEDRTEILHIKRHIRWLLETLPQSHINALEEIEVRNFKHQSRGLANDKKMILHTQSIDDNHELISVITHEMGHIVDLGLLKGTSNKDSEFSTRTSFIAQDDPSLGFYRISWKSSTEKKNNDTTHFVSGYAQTNPFEDFAETYLFYRFHGEKFRSQMKHSFILQQKYAYMKNIVFDSEEFQTHKPEPEIQAFPWDTTLLPLL